MVTFWTTIGNIGLLLIITSGRTASVLELDLINSIGWLGLAGVLLLAGSWGEPNRLL